MQDDNCIADISSKFSEFCWKKRQSYRPAYRTIPPGPPPFWFCSGPGLERGLGFGGTEADMGSASTSAVRNWQILYLIDSGPYLGRNRSRFGHCIRQFWKIFARVQASGLCYCKSRVSCCACRQLGERGVHVSS